MKSSVTGAPPGPSLHATGRDATEAARLPPSRGKRDLFPLPRLKAAEGSSVAPPRRDDRARARRRAVTSINAMSEALNWMHGSREPDEAEALPYPLELSRGRLDPVRFGVLARLEAA